MKLDEIRRLVVVAMFSDDVLMRKLVLKGGNALDLVHGLSHRSSVDIDFSVEGDFTDIADTRARIFRALKDRFDSAGYRVFDEKFAAKPSVIRPDQNPKWGGYLVEFKIIEQEKAKRFPDSMEQLRRNAAVIGPAQQRVFKIDISKHEFCAGKEETQLDDFTIYVYTLPMLAIEKLRALCQQLPGYSLQTTPRPRARDFFDIHTIITRGNVDITTPENRDLVRNIFAAKEVPLSFIGRLSEQRAFHYQDWKSVEQTTRGAPKEFDFYFDFVLELARKLKSAGIE